MTPDPGLQPQRTTLAWTRTGISASALAGVLLRGALRSGSFIAIAAAVVAIAGAVAVFGSGSRIVRSVRRTSGSGGSTDYTGVRLVTGVVMAIAVLTVGTVVAS